MNRTKSEILRDTHRIALAAVFFFEGEGGHEKFFPRPFLLYTTYRVWIKMSFLRINCGRGCGALNKLRILGVCFFFKLNLDALNFIGLNKSIQRANCFRFYLTSVIFLFIDLNCVCFINYSIVHKFVCLQVTGSLSIFKQLKTLLIE